MGYDTNQAIWYEYDGGSQLNTQLYHERSLDAVTTHLAASFCRNSSDILFMTASVSATFAKVCQERNNLRVMCVNKHCCMI